jgi:type I restriction enzyme M protein
MVALPGRLFTNTQIEACIWFLTKDKANGLVLDERKRDRRGETLFIDARNLGYMKDRALRDFTEADIRTIADTFHQWQKGEGYQDEPGFCYSADLRDIRKHSHVLTPGRYVGAPERGEDGEKFSEKVARLVAELEGQMQEGQRLEGKIRDHLKGIGYGIY